MKELEIISKWRVGRTVPLNVYEGDRPVCQCHNEQDAQRIVEALAAVERLEAERQSDTARLDFAEQYALAIELPIGEWVRGLSRGTIRAAIDAAIESRQHPTPDSHEPSEVEPGNSGLTK